MSGTKKAQIFHFDLYGKRDDKYDFLNENSLESIEWKELKPEEPNYFFVDKDFNGDVDYNKGFKITELFKLSACGIVTARDFLTVHYSKKELLDVMADFLSLNEDKFRIKYNEEADSRDWTFAKAKSDLLSSNGNYIKLQHRPFDNRFTYYTGNTKGFMSYPRKEIMFNLIAKNNIALIAPRQLQSEFHHAFVTKTACDGNITSSARLFGAGYVFPLYLYPDQTNQTTFDGSHQRVPNLNMEIVNKFAESVGLHFAAEENPEGATVEINQFHPIDILDYIYAVLHSPAYREKYKEFLKIDFPRVPYPTRPKQFYDLVDLGSQLRKLHLLESEETEKYITQYPIDGNNEVVKPLFLCHPEQSEGSHKGITLGKVYINETQYFDNVPEIAWNFYIGGYQPAQKWLKDRKGRTLEFDDILHYQKIIVALKRTSEIMIEIDKVMENTDLI